MLKKRFTVCQPFDYQQIVNLGVELFKTGVKLELTRPGNGTNDTFTLQVLMLKSDFFENKIFWHQHYILNVTSI